MAIARGAGTEIIRTASFREVDSTNTILIEGEQHHIYTVLSIIIYSASITSASNYFSVKLSGYDSKAGSSAAGMDIFRYNMKALNAFVWNDKFSFNGHEPTNFTGPMDDATKQNAIADQGGPGQYLYCFSDAAADDSDVTITYIDQNNA